MEEILKIIIVYSLLNILFSLLNFRGVKKGEWYQGFDSDENHPVVALVMAALFFSWIYTIIFSVVVLSGEMGMIKFLLYLICIMYSAGFLLIKKKLKLIYYFIYLFSIIIPIILIIYRDKI